MKQIPPLLFLALILCATQIAPSAWSQSPVKLSFGWGYDNISERYYLAHYDTLGVPSESLEVLRRATDEIEEQKALFRFDLDKNLSEDSRLLINNRFSLSSLY